MFNINVYINVTYVSSFFCYGTCLIPYNRHEAYLLSTALKSRISEMSEIFLQYITGIFS